ncbi:hypothetical protein FACS189456_7240 [Bacteroidia bacterium]|nr:hypothetical protein FACS189456_7240 [Bacteroidia bacterium]
MRAKLRSELKTTVRDTDEYRQKLEQLNRIEKERSRVMGEMSGRMETQHSSFGKLANGFNKYFGIITASVAALTGLSLTFRKLAQDVAKMDDTYSDVMKTTGMTRNEVLELNEALKKMDTRTSREELNKLAATAGQNNIKLKEDILGFVDAGNQIRVALGEDLGEDAIKSIGKMVNVYKQGHDELEKLDIRGQMLAIGSAVNELSATSATNGKRWLRCWERWIGR